MNRETRAKMNELLCLLEEEAEVNVSSVDATEYVNENAEPTSAEFEFTAFFAHQGDADEEVEVEVRQPRNYQ